MHLCILHHLLLLSLSSNHVGLRILVHILLLLLLVSHIGFPRHDLVDIHHTTWCMRMDSLLISLHNASCLIYILELMGASRTLIIQKRGSVLGEMFPYNVRHHF